MALHGCRKSVVVKVKQRHLIESEVVDDEKFYSRVVKAG